MGLTAENNKGESQFYLSLFQKKTKNCFLSQDSLTMSDLKQVRSYLMLISLSPIYKFAFWVEFFNHVQQHLHDVHKPALEGALTRRGAFGGFGSAAGENARPVRQRQRPDAGVPAIDADRVFKLPGGSLRTELGKTVEAGPRGPQSEPDQNIAVLMEFCAKVQLVVTQVLGSITGKDIISELSGPERELVSVCTLKVKSFSDAFFLLFDKLSGQNGLCFTAIQEDSFWFFFSLLKLSLGFGIEDSAKRSEFVDQVFGFFDSLVRDAQGFYGLVLAYVLYREKQAPDSGPAVKEIFKRIIAFDRFDEFYQIARDYIQNDLETLFICFHQLFKGCFRIERALIGSPNHIRAQLFDQPNRGLLLHFFHTISVESGAHPARIRLARAKEEFPEQADSLLLQNFTNHLPRARGDLRRLR